MLIYIAMHTIPGWVKKRVRAGGESENVRRMLKKLSVNTVCESAVCPNIYECFCKGYASFMILGDSCTRDCRFCGVSHTGKLAPADAREPGNISRVIGELGMRYVVITSPTRDDLPDGGASHFAAVTRKIHIDHPETKVELLIPDFRGDSDCLQTVFDSKPDVISHNVETVPSLYSCVRPSSDFGTSMRLLRTVKNNGFITKSGFMLGLGETLEEVIYLMQELKKAGCDYLVIGQYLKPSKSAVEVCEYIPEEVFKEYEKTGKNMGFRNVFAGTFYRSSYLAENLLKA